MKKIILILCCFIFAFAMAEAKTYTNTRCGYAIDIPDYFVIKDNYGGKYDLIADGGDNYGTGNLLRGGKGINVSIISSSFEYDEASEDYVINEMEKCLANAEKGGTYIDHIGGVKLSPNHLGYMTLRLDSKKGIMDTVCTIFMHGNKIILSMMVCEDDVEGRKDVVTMGNSFRCIAH